MAASLELPTLRFPVVYHVGDLANQSEQVRSSQEGAMLSVSLHPEEWMEIARIGGDIHALRKEQAAIELLDFHELSKADRKTLLAAAEERGLITPHKMWKAPQWDEESEEWRFSLCDTKREAEDESSEYVDEDGFPGVTPSREWKASPELAAYWNARQASPRSTIDPMMCRDAAIACVVEQSTSLDGIWWQDDLAPESLSAPRGGLFQRVVPQLNVTVERETEDVYPEAGSINFLPRIDRANDTASLPLPVASEAMQESLGGLVH